MLDTKSNVCTIFMEFVKRKFIAIFSKDIDSNQKQEPLNDWEKKVQERKLKTQEAKKVWEENQKQLELKSAQILQESEEDNEIDESPQENIE